VHDHVAEASGDAVAVRDRRGRAVGTGATAWPAETVTARGVVRGSDVVRPREMRWSDPVGAGTGSKGACRGRSAPGFQGRGSEAAKRLVALAVAELLLHCIVAVA
jgi:hypothetical protein